MAEMEFHLCYFSVLPGMSSSSSSWWGWLSSPSRGELPPASPKAEARIWWSGMSFGLGILAGACTTALLLMSSPPSKTSWRKERFGRGALRVPLKEEILERFRLPLSFEDYEEVRATWKRFALVRTKKDGKEAAMCFAEDCSVEDCHTGRGWRGRGGIEDYYADFYAAFPDANFETLDLFIGPQGVVQEVLVTGTHKGKWQSYPPSGRSFHCRMVILMPWDLKSHLFAGQKIYLDSDDVFRQRPS